MTKFSASAAPRDATGNPLWDQLPGLFWSTDQQLAVTRVFGQAWANAAPVAEVDGLGAVFGSTLDDDMAQAHHRALAGESLALERVWRGGRYLFRLQPLRDERRRIVGVAGAGLPCHDTPPVDRESSDSHCLAMETVLAEAELRQAHQRLSFHVTNSPLGFVEWDADWKTVAWSARAEEIFGWRRDEVQGKSWDQWRFVHEDDLQAVARVIERLLTGAEARNINRNRNYTKDGRVIHCEWYNSVLIDADGKLVSYLSLVQDVTARVQAVEALQDSEQRFRAAFEQAAVGIAHLDLNGRWLRVNSKLCDIVDYDRDELRRLKFEDLIDAADADEGPPPLEQLLAGKILTYSREQRCRRRDGSTVWTHLTINRAGHESGEPKHLIAVMQDIHERKKAEAALQQREIEIAHVARLSTMGELVAGLAHELNQPLHAIANYANATARTLELPADPPREKLRRWAQEIVTDTTRAGEIIRRLRDFVRKTAPRRAALEPRQLIREALQLVATEAQRFSVKVVVKVPAALPRVWADDIQIQQVLVNLLRNAYQALSKSAATDRRVVVTARRKRDQIEIAVADNGPGVGPRVKEQLFTPFFTTKSEGMGMGLPICRSILETHGGKLWSKSNREGGATFCFTLPSADPSPSPSSTESE